MTKICPDLALCTAGDACAGWCKPAPELDSSMYAIKLIQAGRGLMQLLDDANAEMLELTAIKRLNPIAEPTCPPIYYEGRREAQWKSETRGRPVHKLHKR